MSNAVYPALPGLQYPIKRTPLWKTTAKSTPSGREWRTTAMVAPRYRLVLQYEFLRSLSAYGEYQALFDFFNARSGSLDSFLFRDPDDSVVTEQLLGISNGSTTQWQLARAVPGVPLNLLAATQDFAAGYWLKQAAGTGSVPVVTADDALAPDGTTTADLVVLDKGAGTTSTDQANISPPTSLLTIAGQSYTFSVWVKSATASTYTVRMDFSGQAGDITTVTVTPVWQRVVITLAAALDRGRRPIIRLRGGLGTSDQASLHLWGAQFQRGTVATSYMPVLDSTVPVPMLEPVVDLAGTPRLYAHDWQGYTQLLPSARTNLCLQSQTLDNASWGKARSTVTTNALAAPDGTTTAELLTEDTTAGVHYANSAYVASTGLPMCSVHLKAGTRTMASVQVIRDSGAAVASVATVVDLSSGTLVSGNGSIAVLDTGWYRITLPAETAGSNYAVRVALHNGTGTTYTGDGASGLYVWGAQIEDGSAATRYIPTTTAAVTVTDYTLGAAGLVTLGAALPSGTRLYWSGSYYWRYRFEADQLEFSKFMEGFWSTGQVALLSVKP